MKLLLGPLLIALAVGLIAAAVQVQEPARIMLMLPGMLALGFGVREVGREARRRA